MNQPEIKKLSKSKDVDGIATQLALIFLVQIQEKIIRNKNKKYGRKN